MEDTGPVGWQEVLEAELAALRPAGGGGLRALCISGGGIRSATFALGAIQELAQRGLLQQFDYLSTVSGGGYIGGWLTAWIQRAGGLEQVRPSLVPNATPKPGEPDPVEHLRDYSNYLTPRLGVFSADTWTVGVTIARNILLNWLVFVPLLLALLMAPRVWLGAVTGDDPARVVAALPWLAAGLMAAGLWNVLRYLPGVGGVNHGTGDFIGFVLAPVAGAAAVFSAYATLRPIAYWPTVGGCIAPCLGAWLAYTITALLPRRAPKRHLHRLRELWALFGAVLMLGIGMGSAAWVLHMARLRSPQPLAVTFGLPLLLLGFSLAAAVFVGLSSRILGTQDREWMARAEAYLMLVAVFWLLACTAVLLAPGWIWGHPWKQWGLAALGAASAAISSRMGFRTGAPASEAAPARGAQHMDLALKLVSLVFIAMLVLGLGLLTDYMMGAILGENWTNHLAIVNDTALGGCLISMAFFAGLGWFMAHYININKFSLQGMYRDRLIRAYLGASNPAARANRFTGFSTSDDMPLHTLALGLRPLQVLNLTLNTVEGERLAWQQRKAESFTATALHCGSCRLGYRSSLNYGGSGGMTLGTAVAISGAAASPNMGYHSSPLVGFIMTLFNVRLGAWLGNPGVAGAKTWMDAGPRSAARALLREAMGKTTAASSYVYLSDGGHFENLGLYEMVRRRCQTIVVLDGGCDPDYTYEDLGNALRKIRIDLKVPIKFSDAGELALRAKKERCAVARILYSEVDSGCPDGVLIYVKPVLLGTEPPDVASYAAAHPSFPHQSTAEQWFDESQTESYRMLGICTVADMTRSWSGRTLEEWAEHLGGTPNPAAVEAEA